MVNVFNCKIIWLTFASFMLLDPILINGADDKFVMFCYMTTMRTNSYWLRAEYVKTHLSGACTHYVFHYAKVVGMAIGGYQLTTVVDDDIVEYATLVSMVENSTMRVLISVDNHEGEFQAMLDSNLNIDTFVDNAVKYMSYYKFDGIALDWQHETSSDSHNYKRAYSYLLTRLHEKLDDNSADRVRGRYILTATLSHNKIVIDSMYLIGVLKKTLDYFIMKTYHYGDMSNRVTFPHNGNYSQFATLKYWVEVKHVHRSKIILGIPMYGRYFYLVRDPEDEVPGTGIDVESGHTIYGKYSRMKDYLTYLRTCEMRREGAKVQWLEAKMVPYLYKGREWVTYENERSATGKVAAAHWLRLAGVMVWHLGDDDFNGECGGVKNASIKFPLVRAVSNLVKMHVVKPRRKTNLSPRSPGYPFSPIVDNTGNRTCGMLTILPDMRDCSKFIKCGGSIQAVLSCPFGLYFDIHPMICNWPNKVAGCNY